MTAWTALAPWLTALVLPPLLLIGWTGVQGWHQRRTRPPTDARDGAAPPGCGAGRCACRRLAGAIDAPGVEPCKDEGDAAPHQGECT